MFDISALAGPAFVVAVDRDGDFRYARLNDAAAARPDLARAIRPGRRLRDVHTPAVAAWIAGRMTDCATRRACVAYDMPVAPGVGACRLSLVPLLDGGGRVTALLGLCHDAPASRAADQDLVTENEHLSLALQALHGAEWHHDVAAGTFHASPEVAVLVGERSPRGMPWSEWLERVHPDDRDAFRGTPSHDGAREFRFRGAGNALRWGRCTCTALRDAVGRLDTILGVMIDITEERGRESALSDLAAHDPLTGLLNRRGFRQEMDRAQAGRLPDAPLALFMVDLDAFKETNDVHGHAAGDAVLAEAARRLGATSGEASLCARLGGDEFIVVAPVSDEAEGERLRTRLAESLRRPLAFRGAWLSLSASVGVAHGCGAVDVVGLMAEADADLYERKRRQSHPRSSAA